MSRVDLCYFIGTCFSEEEQAKYGDMLIKHYWSELTSSPGGPSAEDYPYATMLDDYKKCMWVSMWVTTMGVANLQCIRDEAKRNEGTPAEEACLLRSIPSIWNGHICISQLAKMGPFLRLTFRRLTGVGTTGWSRR